MEQGAPDGPRNPGAARRARSGRPDPSRLWGAVGLALIAALAAGGTPTQTVVLGAPGSVAQPSVASTGESITLADLNGDGLADLIVGSTPAAGPVIYYNNGTATPFATPPDTLIANAPNAGPVYGRAVVGDVDGDGRPDLITRSDVAPATVFLNNGTATPFRNVSGINVGTQAGITGKGALADVNGDGFADLLVAVVNGQSLLFLTHGAPLTSGNYSSVTVGPAQGTATDGALVDVNGDGRPDLLLAWMSGSDGNARGGVYVYLNNGTSTPFANVAPSRLFSAQSVFAFAVADLNQDGRPDLAVAATNFTATQARLSVLLNSGSRTQPYAAVQPLPVDAGLSECFGVSVADLNADGWPDLQFACVASPRQALGAAKMPIGALYLNNGTGTPFAGAVPVDIPSASNPGADIGLVGEAIAAGPVVSNGLPVVLVTVQTDTFFSPVVVYPLQLQGAPVAEDDAALCAINAACPIGVLGNDRAIPGRALDPASLALVGAPAHGTAAPAGGVLTYTPMAGYTGADALQYVVSDTAGNLSNVANVDITVQAAPVARDDSATIVKGQSVRIDVLANDSSAGGSVQPGSLQIVTAPAHGVASVDSGRVFYVANVGYSGADAFTYTVADNLGTVSNAATVTVSVSAPATPYVNADLGAIDNVFAIASDGQAPQHGGLDNHGYALAGTLLGATQTWGGTAFSLGRADMADGANNVLLSAPRNRYGAVRILATAVNGAQTDQPLLIDYIDGTQPVTQSFSDWGSPQHFAGEAIVSTLAYRVTPAGAQQSGAWHVYGYTIPLDPTRLLVGIRTPTNRNVVILAASFDPSPAPTSVPLAFGGINNAYAIADGAQPGLAGLDGLGYSYATQLLGAYVLWGGVPFQMPAVNAPSAFARTTVQLSGGFFSQLALLATGYKGSQPNQTLTVIYADGSTQSVTQGFSDWGAPQHYAGEAIARTMAYRYRPDGSTQPGSWNLYGYTLAIDPTKQAVALTLPAANVTLLAVTQLP